MIKNFQEMAREVSALLITNRDALMHDSAIAKKSEIDEKSELIGNINTSEKRNTERINNGHILMFDL